MAVRRVIIQSFLPSKMSKANKHNTVICQIQWEGWQLHLFPSKSLSLLLNFYAFNFLYPNSSAVSHCPYSWSIFILQSVMLKFLWLNNLI